MMSYRTRRLILTTARYIAVALIVVSVAYLAVTCTTRLTSGNRSAAEPQIGSQAQIEAIVTEAAPKAPLFIEYTNGALKIVLPSLRLEDAAEHAPVLEKLCRSSAEANVRLEKIAFLNRDGRPGFFVDDARSLCTGLTGTESAEARAAAARAAASTVMPPGGAEAPFWTSAEGQALFGPAARPASAAKAALDALPPGPGADQLKDDLQIFTPNHVTVSRNQVIVALRRAVVTPDAIAPILTAICQSDDAAGDIAVAQQLVVMNANFTQAVVFDGTGVGCSGYGALNGAEAKALRDRNTARVLCVEDVMDCLPPPVSP